MMSRPELLSVLDAEPFVPLRVHLLSGDHFDVHHPDAVGVGKSTVTVFTPRAADRGGVDQFGDQHWQRFSLLYIESVEPLGEE